jgi:transcriptional regulator with XRE-family HTH domain
MGTATDRFPFREQFQILMTTQVTADGRPYPLGTLAKAAGLSEKSLQKMLDGRTQNPRLDSVRRICRFYRISLDYFDCETKAACLAFLAQNAAEGASLVVRTIDQEAETLPSAAKHQVLRLLERFRFLRSSGKP